LMIIKASLRTLASERVSRDDMRQALTDVDEEVARLNRVVNDVLDFARPIRFDYAPADINALCADAEEATRAGHQDMHVTIQPDPALGIVVTDAERLRIALVNILTNARHAVAARAPVAQGSPAAVAQGVSPVPDIQLTTHRAPNSFTITVCDRGGGVKPEDLPRVFDPYFTTKRTGSGLGLAIAKNIIDGMGGSIALDNHPGDGTEIRIDLPLQPEASAAGRATAASSGETMPKTDRGGTV
jgi:signal transduction histidine kinase